MRARPEAAGRCATGAARDGTDEQEVQAELSAGIRC